MYPAPTPNQWSPEDPENVRYPPVETGAYPPRDPQPGFPPRRDFPPPNGFAGREDEGRHPYREGPERYDSRDEDYRYAREDDLDHHTGGLEGQGAGRHSPGKELAMNMANSDLYRMPHDPYSRHAHQMSFAQPAPRQRTAIACRYCRRRKIRCSGFESSQDGRCSNCQRFNQECIFTPVSSQTQAFVPAHTQYPQMRQIPGRGGARPAYPPGHVQLYGAHGQPLSIPSEYTQGNPSHHSFAGRSGSPAFTYDDYESGNEPRAEDRERERGGHGEIHPPSLPPLPRRSSQGDYPSHWSREPVSPPTLPLAARGYSPPNGPTHPTGYGESAPSTFYPPTPTRRTSPPTPYAGERPTSISPHPTIHPPMWPGPPRPESAGPPTTHTVPSLHPMQLANIIDQSQPQQRSAHDNEMLNQLKRGI